ncbi:MAG: putative Fe-S protein YdhL (DUF1289 family) [Alteromonadaceae bacterium]|jgi:predicted Fe-S protein YdhL (DUF1289 family)
MQQLELLSIESPCINVCQSNKRGYCLGCFRSRDERFNWTSFTPEEKGKVLALCKQRNRRRKSQDKKHQQEQMQLKIPMTTITEQPPIESSAEAAEKPQTVQDMGLDIFDL